MAVNGGRAGTKKGPNWGHVVLGTEPWTPPSNPPRRPLLRGRFDIDLASIRHRFHLDFLI